MKAFFGTNKTKDVSFRRQQLRNVLKLMEENKDRILDALMADLHKVAKGEGWASHLHTSLKPSCSHTDFLRI